ncbi:MAG: hypothetical protein NVSMB21_12930 [Vulcanimicrobiaceae bacterium]
MHATLVRSLAEPLRVRAEPAASATVYDRGPTSIVATHRTPPASALGPVGKSTPAWYDDGPAFAGTSGIMGLSSFDGLIRGQYKQAELRALLKRSQRVYTRTTTTHSLPNLG